MDEDQTPTIPMGGGCIGGPNEDPGRDGGIDPPFPEDGAIRYNPKIIRRVNRLEFPPFPPFEFGVFISG
jgi:hypothetical protein